MGTKLISKYQPGGKTNKDDKKGKKKEQPLDNNLQVILGLGIPSYYRPFVYEPVIDNMGGLGAGVAQLQRMRDAEIAREEAAKREQAQYQAYLRQAGLTPSQMSYDKWVYFGKPTSVPRQAYFSQSHDTRTPQLIENDKKMRQYKQQLDEQAAVLGHALGAAADLNVEQLNANTMAGANVFMGVANPLALGSMYTSADLAQGNYGAAAFDAGLTLAPGARLFVRGMRPVVLETRQAVRLTLDNVGLRVNTAREAARSAAFEPAYQPVPIAVGNYGGYMNLPGNYNQMFFHPIKGMKAGWKALWGEGKAATLAATETATATNPKPSLPPVGRQVVNKKGNRLDIFREKATILKGDDVFKRLLVDTEEILQGYSPVNNSSVLYLDATNVGGKYFTHTYPKAEGTTFGGGTFSIGRKPIEVKPVVERVPIFDDVHTSTKISYGTERVPVGMEEPLNINYKYFNNDGTRRTPGRNKSLTNVRTASGYDYNLTTGEYSLPRTNVGNGLLNSIQNHPVRWGLGTALVVGPRIFGSSAVDAYGGAASWLWDLGKRFVIGDQKVNELNATKEEQKKKEEEQQQSQTKIDEANKQDSIRGLQEELEQAAVRDSLLNAAKEKAAQRLQLQ